jgi:uncharacterized protein YjbJ (UPF0337 family)
MRHPERRIAARLACSDSGTGEMLMNEDLIKARWKMLKGDLKKRWGKLTDDDLTYAAGHRDYLVGKLQERYGLAKEKAAEQVRDFERAFERTPERESL